jgi:riboflavin synthase
MMQVVSHEKKGQDSRLTLSSQFHDFKTGESISVDGTCLTVVDFKDSFFTCELSHETLGKTISHDYQMGTVVNLERALLMSDRLGGHFVMGHVDGRLTLLEKKQIGDCTSLKWGGFALENAKYLVPKGWIAINGVSLTVNEVGADYFNVTVIPHTSDRTNLGMVEVGCEANVEFDWMAKMILRSREIYEPRG